MRSKGADRRKVAVFSRRTGNYSVSVTSEINNAEAIAINFDLEVPTWMLFSFYMSAQKQTGSDGSLYLTPRLDRQRLPMYDAEVNYVGALYHFVNWGRTMPYFCNEGSHELAIWIWVGAAAGGYYIVNDCGLSAVEL